MKKITAFLGILISWSVICAPIVHADNLGGAMGNEQESSCSAKDSSQTDCCFENNSDKNINISHASGEDNGKTRTTKNFKQIAIIGNSVFVDDSKQRYKPPVKHKQIATLIVGSSVKLE